MNSLQDIQGRTDRQTNRWTDNEDYYGSNRVNLGSKILLKDFFCDFISLCTIVSFFRLGDIDRLSKS